MWNFFGEAKKSIQEFAENLLDSEQCIGNTEPAEILFNPNSFDDNTPTSIGEVIISSSEETEETLVGPLISTDLTPQNFLLQDKDVDYIDIDFTLWLSWMLAPLLITFLLPLMIVILLYFTALVLYIYKLHWHTLRRTYGTGGKWDAARKTAAAIWDAHGWIWHGYEVRGLDNIPNEEPILFIYYHGAIPIDMYYFLAKVLLYKNRLIHTVADHFLFKIPGFPIISECMKVVPGTVQTCSNILKEGNLLAISPGGVYESQFSHQYNLLWKKRLGFAKVALDAKVAIIPIFTENVREAFRTLNIGRKMFLKLYALTKFPFAPIYGGFPVKMITHVGKPIMYDPSLTPEQLQNKVALAINELIERHQRKPGNIMHALVDRIPYCKERHKTKDPETHHE